METFGPREAVYLGPESYLEMNMLSQSLYHAPSQSVAALLRPGRLWSTWNCRLDDKMELRGGAGPPEAKVGVW